MPRKIMDTPPATPGDDQPTTPAPTTEPGQGGSIAGKIVIGAIVLLLLGATGTAGYYYKQLADIKKNPSKVAQDQTKVVIDAVSKLMILPTGEQPTVATVSDPAKLKDQTFFVNAKVGDKVLIYTNAKKAILYSPAENKIVEVAPVNLGDTPAVSGATTSDTAKTAPAKTTK